MKRAILSVAVVMAVALAGCAAPPVQRVFQISAPYDVDQAVRQLQPGSNTVKGSAFMRQNGGGVVTCAGSVVTLVPTTAYAKERIDVMYGSVESGPQILLRGTFSPDHPGYRTNVRETKCDAQGAFSFDRVADGEFFVVTRVSWSVGYSSQGGSLMHRVTLKNGQVVNIVIST